MKIQKDNLSPKYILKKELGVKDSNHELLFMDFTKVSTNIFSNLNKELSPQDKFVLLILLKYRNKEGVSYPNQETIAEIMSCIEKKQIKSTGESKIKKVVRNNISKSIKNLEKNGYLKIIKSSSFNRDDGVFGYCYNMYQINRDKFPEMENNWEKIPNSLILKSNFTWQQRLFIIQLYPFVLNNINEIHYPKLFLSKKMGLSYPTLCSKFKEFEYMGIIEQKEKGYSVDVFKMMEIPNEIVEHWIKKYENVRNNINISKKSSKVYQNKIVEVSKEVDSIDPDFEYIDDEECFTGKSIFN